MRKLLVPTLFALAAAAAVLTGCATSTTPGAGGTASATTSTVPTGDASPTPSTPDVTTGALTVTRTGGIAGVRQTLAVTADGSWVYTDGKTGATDRGMFTADQRTAVVQMLSNPALLAQLSQRPTNAVCNDGFVYTVSLGTEQFSFTDCGGNGLPKQLIAALSAATPF